MGEFDAGRSRPAKDDLRSGMIGLIAEMKEPVRILSLPGRNWRLERGLLRAGVLFESSAFEKRSGTYWECVEGAPGQLVGTGKGYTEWRSGRPGRWSRLRLQKKDIFTALELGGLDTDVSWFDLCGPVLPDWIPLIQSQKAKTRSLFALTFLKGRNWGMAAHEVKYAGGYREWTRASFGEPTQWVEYHDTSPMVLAVWAKGQGDPCAHTGPHQARGPGSRSRDLHGPGWQQEHPVWTARACSSGGPPTQREDERPARERGGPANHLPAMPDPQTSTYDQAGRVAAPAAHAGRSAEGQDGRRVRVQGVHQQTRLQGPLLPPLHAEAPKGDAVPHHDQGQSEPGGAVLEQGPERGARRLLAVDRLSPPSRAWADHGRWASGWRPPGVVGPSRRGADEGGVRDPVLQEQGVREPRPPGLGARQETPHADGHVQAHVGGRPGHPTAPRIRAFKGQPDQGVQGRVQHGGQDPQERDLGP